jgi:hypothetical protein
MLDNARRVALSKPTAGRVTPGEPAPAPRARGGFPPILYDLYCMMLCATLMSDSDLPKQPEIVPQDATKTALDHGAEPFGIQDVRIAQRRIEASSSRPRPDPSEESGDLRGIELQSFAPKMLAPVKPACAPAFDAAEQGAVGAVGLDAEGSTAVEAGFMGAESGRPIFGVGHRAGGEGGSSRGRLSTRRLIWGSWF